ncbi:(2Fe-2S)-binding protein [Blautia hydrogenotrophica]|uniref:BFD-like [2Fe-2S]-binding domain-containing protein n=2 Tax=Blautia hydrogenotrophica TaxID=53443 RepID=C0CJ60_BLAHS|nr:(2Fe-2S)-binding protein [Blautia hydrogenotrophica]EEG50171.1 [2Fe-2S]-binding domain protein [Blautia hydrogenotrophica DSM 10507]MEE0463757.1 (2Fe-2S)-binding protein [Blautia hydrogenotrophica]
MMENDIIICRCQEVTRQEILDAIEQGATTVDGVKRRTRAGMGLCQGKTCERLVAKIISQETGIPMEQILPQTKRMPVRPVKIGILGGSEDE